METFFALEYYYIFRWIPFSLSNIIIFSIRWIPFSLSNIIIFSDGYLFRSQILLYFQMDTFFPLEYYYIFRWIPFSLSNIVIFSDGYLFPSRILLYFQMDTFFALEFRLDVGDTRRGFLGSVEHFKSTVQKKKKLAPLTH